jgi:hypothetical protein
MTKRNFYGIFRPAWLESFTSENIQGGFKKAGIWPFNPPLVLDIIKRRPLTPPIPEDQARESIPTPLTLKSIRRAQRRYKDNPTKQNLDIIFQSQERLAAQHEVDKHMQSGLLETLKNEKKRRQRGKKLNLVGEEDTGPQLFHSSRVFVAQGFEAEKQAKVAAEKADKEAKKAQGAENKRKKEQEAKERALQRQVVRDAKAAEAAKKLAAKEAKKKAT